MIHLKRISKPQELTREYVRQKVEEYKKSQTAVWNAHFVRARLLEMCHGKCSYCESAIGEESAYLTVDHFFPKSVYPDEVMDWKNFVPSCLFCNSSKKELNPRVFPMINPYNDIPQQHLHLNAHYISYIPIDTKGRNTRKFLNLNDSAKHATPRYKVIYEMENRLATLSKLLDDSLLENQITIDFLQTSIGDVLKICQPTEKYSAILATCVLNNTHYQNMKEVLLQHNAWSVQMDILEQQMENIRYQVDK